METSTRIPCAFRSSRPLDSHCMREICIRFTEYPVFLFLESFPVFGGWQGSFKSPYKIEYRLQVLLA